ncbi:hypothetical protein [Micromonospora sp. NPDC001898]|uniref:hypothetical protein n=1 Tax=Micromonospora sp. NPDC001898 TaxID=3364221 RepID=UPI00368927DD
MTYPPQQPDPTPAIPAPQPQPWVDPAGQPYPPAQQPAAFPTPPVKPSYRPLIVVAAATVGVLAIGTIGYVVWDGYIKEDSGVAACKAMRDGKSPDGSADVGDDEKLTEAQYREAREVFEDSRHEKIREHGTALMDVAWQVNQLPKGQEMGALAYMGPLTTHMSGLQTACADQGVIVDLNKD